MSNISEAYVQHAIATVEKRLSKYHGPVEGLIAEISAYYRIPWKVLEDAWFNKHPKQVD